MNTTKTFRWTSKAKADLIELAEVPVYQKGPQWKAIGEQFRKKYPDYNSADSALKKQYSRIKSSKQPQNEHFKWQKDSIHALCTIVDKQNNLQEHNWPEIHKLFSKSYPEFSGSIESLRKEYFRHKKDNLNTFVWSNQAQLDMVRLVNLISVDDYPNWTKIFYTFRRQYPMYNCDKWDLKRHYEHISNSENLEMTTEQMWDESLDVILAQSISNAKNIRSAQIRDGRKKIIENLAKMSVQRFKITYKKIKGVDYAGVDSIVFNKYYKQMENENIQSCKCIEDIDTTSNCNNKRMVAFASKNHTLTFLKVFGDCCHNCGTLFPRADKNTRVLLSNPIGGVANILDLSINHTYDFQSAGKYITCIECNRNPNWSIEYHIFSEMPSELQNLNEYEQNQIALCGGFYSIYQRQNAERRIFEHRQGECNVGKKRDQDYHNIFTTYFNIERPHQFATSNSKIKAALRWLKQYNHLYVDFLSNYETIYGYLMRLEHTRPDERIIQISNGRLEDIVGEDTSGLFIPAENVRVDNPVSIANEKFGIQHPIQIHLDKIRKVINVNYGDPDIEAKRWPHLFPTGKGSWKPNSSLKQQTYVKKRLTSIDSRFRQCKEFMFFWYDRLIKQRISYYNFGQRSVKVNELVHSLRAADIRDKENRYGSVIPTTIPGSRNYWNARTSDLLAIVRDLGKPDLFVTLTQNDNWPELQSACMQLTKAELVALDQPIMQPAVGGKSIVNFPVETTVAFYKRLEIFMKACVHAKHGPFGEVVDYWYRIEYQNRGALHCHMILWICENTMPDDVILAELPRYSGTDSSKLKQTVMAREYVKTFQMHSCSVGQCIENVKSRCKYGFKFAIQHEESINDSRMGYTYIRRNEEDLNVVPYNLYALLLWNGHLNVQKVTANGIEAYLTKYITKPEKTIEIREMTSDAAKFLKSRIVGILECCSHLLQYQQVRCTRKTIFLPCDFKPGQRMLKRKAHLPIEADSEDIYYSTLLDKYLKRPKELDNYTYVDLYRFYDVVSINTKDLYTQSDKIHSTDNDSEIEFQAKLDESQFEYNGRKKSIRSQRMIYKAGGYQYIERGKHAIPRWRFIVPFGKDTEKYYEQHLLLNVPISFDELNADGFPFSDENSSKTFVEECCLQGLVDSEATAKSALLGAIQRGFSVNRVIEIATTLVDQSYVAQEYVDSIIVPWVETMPDEEFQEHKEIDDEHGEELSRMLELRVKFEPYQTYFESMTDSQRNLMEWVDRKILRNDVINACIVGGAGVGKSFITKALHAYFVEKKMMCILLATTGSAAHLISGTTVHYYLKMDIEGNKFMQPGTMSAKIIEDTDVIILDEFSMLQYDMLNNLDDGTKQFSKAPHTHFGGKHIFLIGDPLQIPAIGKSVFSNPLLGIFSILLLKETVRQSDTKFANLLNRVRLNEMTEGDKNVLRERYVHVSEIEFGEDTLIVTATRKKMNFYNHKFIDLVPGEKITIYADDYERDTNKRVSESVKEKIRRYLNNLWDEKLVLKEGCIVRLLRNLDVLTGWVNSKRAKVLRVAADGSYVVLQDIHDPSKQFPLTKMIQPFKLGQTLYYRSQFPLKLGYSTTVHSVQGTTVLGRYYVDLDRSFWESGQAFVALSRPKDIGQLHLLNTHFEKVFVDPYYKKLINWMTDVDEIGLFRKPRFFGDFPLLPLNEGKNVHTFPPPMATQKQNSKVIDRPFKLPRVTKTRNNIIKRTENACLINNRRVYQLVDRFMEIATGSAIIADKIRFGSKFADLLLAELNKALNIYNVIDPILHCKDGKPTEPEVMRKWDEQITMTRDLLGKYSCRFESELNSLKQHIKRMQVCKYAQQRLHPVSNELTKGRLKYHPVHVAGDGRCFYHAVSMNLIGSTILTNSLKLLLAIDILKHFDIYEDVFSNIASSASNVILKSLSLHCWADLEVMFGMSFFLDRPISVVTRLTDFENFYHQRINPSESESDAIVIAHVFMSELSLAPDHFIALLIDETEMPELGNANPEVARRNIEITDLPESDVEMNEIDSDESL